jgi:hypothetical protein
MASERLTPITKSASRSALVLTPAVAGFFAASILDSATNKRQKKADSHNQEIVKLPFVRRGTLEDQKFTILRSTMWPKRPMLA